MFTHFSDINDAVNTAFYFILVISAILLLLITGLMVWFVVKYRRSRHPVPSQIGSHTILEVVWTVVPTILVLGMFYYGWIGYRYMRNVPQGAMEVQATAQMWSWQFQYENGKQSSELHVPAGTPIKVNLQSRDVIHSFFLPAYMVKMDVVPGLESYVWFNPADTGTFDIFCAEYCGQRHSYMLSKVVVTPPDEFDAWVNSDLPPPDAADGEAANGDDAAEQLRRRGKQLSMTKGCVACHTLDGSQLVGPSYKGLYGKTETVVTDGKTRQVVVDDAYIRKSILDPTADVVDGFQPLMPPQQGLVTEDDIKALIEYIKSVK